MAQQQKNDIADPLVSGIRDVFSGKAFRKGAGDAAKKADESVTKQDTSWHDAEVKKANDSFRKLAEEKEAQAAKTAQTKKTSAQKPAARPAVQPKTVKKMQAKRVTK